MLTVYFYLNDVTAGGGTRFPALDVTVTPKQGRVVIWPSVLDGSTDKRDPRTEHEALPVEEGIKYGTFREAACSEALLVRYFTLADEVICLLL